MGCLKNHSSEFSFRVIEKKPFLHGDESITKSPKVPSQTPIPVIWRWCLEQDEKPNQGTQAPKSNVIRFDSIDSMRKAATGLDSHSKSLERELSVQRNEEGALREKERGHYCVFSDSEKSHFEPRKPEKSSFFDVRRNTTYDPLGENGGTYGLYSYVSGDPIQYSDFLGLFEVKNEIVDDYWPKDYSRIVNGHWSKYGTYDNFFRNKKDAYLRLDKVVNNTSIEHLTNFHDFIFGGQGAGFKYSMARGEADEIHKMLNIYESVVGTAESPTLKKEKLWKDIHTERERFRKSIEFWDNWHNKKKAFEEFAASNAGILWRGKSAGISASAAYLVGGSLASGTLTLENQKNPKIEILVKRESLSVAVGVGASSSVSVKGEFYWALTPSVGHSSSDLRVNVSFAHPGVTAAQWDVSAGLRGLDTGPATGPSTGKIHAGFTGSQVKVVGISIDDGKTWVVLPKALWNN